MSSTILNAKQTEAAGRLFTDAAESADNLHKMVAHAIELIGDGETDDATVLLVACRDLLGRIGAAADEGSTLCGAGRLRDDALAWTLTPAGAAKLREAAQG